MPARSNRLRNQQLQKYRKKLLASFSDYENTVTFISSIEAWFNFKWGVGGEQTELLKEFDRFPKVDGLTPDFVVTFAPHYLLFGEVMKNFREEKFSAADTKQILAYSRWRPPDAPGITHDVLLLVSAETDDVAARLISKAKMKEEAKKGEERASPLWAPIVVVGWYKDSQRINGEWYVLKWRDMQGNEPFTRPNISPDTNEADLNREMSKVDRLTIRVDAQALDITSQVPFINDDPPPAYTFVRAVVPIVNSLLTEEERDELVNGAKVRKVLSVDEIANSPMLAGVKGPAHRYIKQCVDWLVANRLAERDDNGDENHFVMHIDLDSLRKELKEFVAEKAARRAVSQFRKSAQKRMRRGKESKGQLRLFN